MNKQKYCIIHNGRFSYEMIVDGFSILFSNACNADYFEEHYTKLGYHVERSGNGSLNYGEVA